MNRKWFAGLVLTGWVLCHGLAAYADAFTFATLPLGGDISGPAGSTIGWGYVIGNTSLTDWLVPTSLSADLFQNGTPDDSIFNFPVLSPGASLSVPFDLLSGTGLYSLTWYDDAPLGFINSGTFILSGEWWDNDPFAGGNFLDIAPDASARYSAMVSSATPSPVPEPSTWLLVLTGLVALYLKSKRSRRQSSR